MSATVTTGNAQVIRDLYDAFGRGDVPAVLAVLADDVAWTEADGFPYAGTYRGPQAVLEGVFMRLGGEWDGYRVVPEEIIDGGERIVSIGTYSGTYKATGRAFQAPFAHVWRLRDGKIAEFRQFTDTVLVRRAID